jgi:TolB-like protein/Flp pilus assembly protein TadD
MATPAVPLSEGKRLSHFRVIRKIGEGGMGVVFLARDEHLERDVALKVLPPGMLVDQEARRRFRQEALALSRLNHPNIAVVHDFDTQDGVDFLVMEFVPGTTLCERFAAGPVEESQIVDLGMQLADALIAAHEQGILHRDLKPGNLRLTPEGRLKVLDFGLAKLRKPAPGQTLAQTMTETGAMLGTPAYMAPEQLRGERADERTDLYAAGAVLYELTSGCRPHPEEQPVQLVDAVLNRPPTSLRKTRPDLSPQLERIILKALERDPAARYGSARELRSDLEQLLAGTSSAASPGARVRTRLWVAAGAVLLAAALAAAAWQAGFLPGPPWARRGAAAPRRIVVLPFDNLGRPEDEYFTAGVTDEITSRLAAVGGLSVISRSSALRYAGSKKAVRQIGHELGVAYILEGTVRWASQDRGGGQVRITPQLVRVSDDTQVWSETYDRVVRDIFAVQSDIAQQVIRELGLTLQAAERRRIELRSTASPEAYQCYLRGRYLAAQPHFSVETWRDVIRNYEEAVRLDPSFAQAWAELSRAHARFYYLKADLSEKRSRLAREALDRAAALAPGSPEVHLATAYFHMWVDADQPRAIAELAAAERGRPNDTEILLARSADLEMRGRYDEAREVLERAFTLSPHDIDVASELALIEWVTRRYERAEFYCDTAFALAPDAGYRVWPNLYHVFIEWGWKGATPEARRALERVPREHEWAPWTWFWQEMYEGRYREALEGLASVPGGWIRTKVWAAPTSLYAAFAHEALHRPEQARRSYASAQRELEEAVRVQPDDPRLHSSLGLAYAGLGRTTEAIREGRRAVELLPLSRDAFYGIAPLQDLSVIYARVGQPDAAIDVFEQLLSIPSWISPTWLRIDPRYRPLADHPRFRRLLGEHPSAP